MDGLYGAGWENRPEVLAHYEKLRNSYRVACQYLMDEGVLYSTVNDTLTENVNDFIENGKMTPHGRI